MIKIIFHTLKNIKIIYITCSFPCKVVCVDGKFSIPVVLYRGKHAVSRYIKTILEERNYCKKIIKKHFDKNLVMCAEDEERSQLSKNCWICNKSFDSGDNKVRDHCHVTGKYRGPAYWSCNINLKLTKKVPVIFHNLRGCDSHLIMQETGKYDVKVSIILNGLEKYVAVTINKSLVFFNNM